MWSYSTLQKCATTVIQAFCYFVFFLVIATILFNTACAPTISTPLDSIIKHMFVDWPNFLQTLHGYSILPFAPSHILSKAFHHHHHYTRYLSIILVTRSECYSQYMSERYVSTSILKPVISQPHLSKYHLVFAL